MGKRVKTKLTTPDGGKPWDDGIQSGWKLTTEEFIGALIAHHEKNGTPTETQTGPDPLDHDMEMAERYLEYVAENADTLAEGDESAAHRLWAYLGNLREALDGGDVRHAGRTGVEFGKALEQLRVRLEATAVKRGRDNFADLESGRDCRTRQREELDAKVYAVYKGTNPKLSQRRRSEMTAKRLNQNGGSNDWTPEKVRPRVRRVENG